MMQRYVLDADGNPLPMDDFLVYALWMNDQNNVIVKVTEIGTTKVSTAFLGLDMRLPRLLGYARQENPILWETMIFTPRKAINVGRYDSREKAVAGHDEAVRHIEEKRSRISQRFRDRIKRLGQE